MNRFFPLVMALLVACGGKEGPIEPIPNPHDITNLEPGQVRVLKPSDIPNGIDLGSVSDARDFLIVVGNTAQSATENVATYVVRGNLGTGASLTAATSLAVPQQIMERMEAVERAQAPQRQLEKRIRAFERKSLNLRGRRQVRGSGLSFSRSIGVASVPTVGEVLNLKVPDGNGDNLCQDFFQTQAVVASVGQRAVLAVDTLDGDPLSLGFTQADFDAINAEFDNLTYPTDVAYFGTPTDVDANQRIIILFTGRVNQLTPSGTPEAQGFVGGFFFAGDFFPPTAPAGQFACPQSNEAEIFYLLAPDPAGLKYGNIRSVASVRQGTRGTIAHEFQHMINAGLRFEGGVAEEFEVPWLDEGLAHLGEEVVGRRLKGFSDLQPLTHADVFPNEAGRNDYNAFFFQNFARFRLWMQRPDTSSGISRGAAENLSSRGAAWAFVRYSADHFSSSNPPAFTRRLVAGPDTGLVNFNKVTATPLDTVVAGYLVANYADDLAGFNITNARTQYRSLNLRNLMPPINNGVYPLRVQALSGSGSTSLTGTNRTGSGNYYTLSVAANAGAKNVKVLDTGGSLVSYPGAHVYVLRVR